MEELMQDKNNNIDLNNNGIPDWAEERQDDWENHPTEPGSPFSFAYKNEKQVAKLVPDYKSYKWYKQPEEGYYYSYGEKLENAIESGEITPDELPENSAIQKEAEQLTDSNPNNDEVNNQAVKEVTQEVYDNMSIEDIEKADAAAIKGEGDYITVAKDLGFDNEDDFLYYFEQEGYKPEDINNLTEEQKEEIKNTENKEDKFAKLKGFLAGFGGKVNTEEMPITEKEETKQPPEGVSRLTVGHSFLGGSGGGGASASGGIKVNADIDNSNNSHSNAGGSKADVKVEDVDANTASMNGANKSEHIDDTLDSLSFKETEHEKDIKTDEQADLPDAEFHSEKKERFELPDIKEMLSEQGGGNYLPFKFTVENGELYVSQIGTGRKLPFDDFLKAEPFAGKQIIELMNGDK